MRYILTTDQMVENDYPVPSYVAEVFEKSPGWAETPQPSTSSQSAEKQPRIYAIDCEMVCHGLCCALGLSDERIVYDRGWQGVDESMYH